MLSEQIVYKRRVDSGFAGSAVQLPGPHQRRLGAFVQEVVKEHLSHIELDAPVALTGLKKLPQRIHGVVGTMQVQVNAP